MEAIYLDNPLTPEQVKSTLHRLFPELQAFYWDIETGLPEEYVSTNTLHILFHIEYTQEHKELQYQISIFRTPDEDELIRSAAIGRALSTDHGVRTLAAWADIQDPDFPYYDLIFQDGKTWLADDEDTNFADGTEGLVKIIREYEFPEYRFDAKGMLIK